MATLRPEAIPPGQDERAWALVEIVAAADSGSATVPSAAIDGESGVLVDITSGIPLPPEKAVPVIVKRGSWRLLDPLANAASLAGGGYYWTEPIQMRIQVVGPEQVYSPFTSGGVILCGFSPTAQGADQFRPVFLVPQGWERYVRPAWEFLAGHPTLLFDTSSGSDEVSRVNSVVASPNPIVSVLGLSRALPLGLLKGRQLARVPPDRAAEFVFLLLESSDHDTDWEAMLAQSPHDLTSTARGALACALLGRNPQVSRSRARELLLAIRTKVRREDPAAMYIGRVFELLGINAT
jgi:hypothetical protein